MAVLISDEDYKELNVLRSYYKREENLKSVQSIENLERDIDDPIRTIVAMFALLGCDPRFSCCGFDYHGQLIHKTHEYGNAYIMLSNNSNTEQVIDYLVKDDFLADTFQMTSKWRTWNVERDKVVFVALAFDWEDSQRKYPWTKHNCIHYAEKGVIGLYALRRKLYLFRDSFLENATLYDTNEKQSDALAYWQYPSLAPWKIEKEHVLMEVEKELNLE